MSNSAKFWDRMARRYSKQPIKDEASYQEKLRRTRQYLGPALEVVEIGCGTGSTAIAHAPHVKHVLATDVSSAMIDIARDKANDAGANNVTFEVASVDQTKLADESVDVVLALNVLHLLEDHEQALERIYTALKPNGVFISSTACLGDMSRALRFFLPLGKTLRLLPHISFFTRTQLEQNLDGAGFDVEDAWQPGEGKAVFIVARKPV